MTQNDREKLHEYLELCWRIYQRMRRENAWPWADDDSPDREDVVESEDSKNSL